MGEIYHRWSTNYLKEYILVVLHILRGMQTTVIGRVTCPIGELY